MPATRAVPTPPVIVPGDIVFYPHRLIPPYKADAFIGPVLSVDADGWAIIDCGQYGQLGAKLADLRRADIPSTFDMLQATLDAYEEAHRGDIAEEYVYSTAQAVAAAAADVLAAWAFNVERTRRQATGERVEWGAEFTINGGPAASAGRYPTAIIWRRSQAEAEALATEAAATGWLYKRVHVDPEPIVIRQIRRPRRDDAQ